MCFKQKNSHKKLSNKLILKFLKMIKMIKNNINNKINKI